LKQRGKNEAFLFSNRMKVAVLMSPVVEYRLFTVPKTFLIISPEFMSIWETIVKMNTLLNLRCCSNWSLHIFVSLWLGYSWWLFFALLLLQTWVCSVTADTKQEHVIYLAITKSGLLVAVIGVSISSMHWCWQARSVWTHSMDRIFGMDLNMKTI